MNTPLILSTLKNLGFTSYEAKIYLTFLERDTLSVPEISRLAQVPRPSAYEALDKLMSKGMCISKPGHTKKYSASDPTVLQERFFVEPRCSTVESTYFNPGSRSYVPRNIQFFCAEDTLVFLIENRVRGVNCVNAKGEREIKESVG